MSVDKFNEITEGAFAHLDITVTDRSIAEFVTASRHYARCGKPTRGILHGYQYVSWDDVEVDPGETPQALTVVDMGDCRVCIYGLDLHRELS